MTTESLTYDSDAGLYYVDVSMDQPDSVPDAVVYSAAEILDRDPVSLPPLGDVVDADSLGQIFQTAGESESDVSVSFEYSGLVVAVDSSGRIEFEERE